MKLVMIEGWRLMVGTALICALTATFTTMYWAWKFDKRDKKEGSHK